MLTIVDAQKAMKEARGTFDVKTTNKVYVRTKTDPTMLTDDQVAAHTVVMGCLAQANGPDKAELQKAIRRNKNQLESAKARLRTNNPNGGTPYERGKKMKEDNMLYVATGNCGEQAAVAAFLAITADRSIQAKTYLVTVCPPGDHVFCVTNLATAAAPSWKTVADMENDLGFGIIIDPWMNFVCDVYEYKKKAKERMDRWLSKGKRIWWQGNNGKYGGWYQPGGDYVARFLDSRLMYEAA